MNTLQTHPELVSICRRISEEITANALVESDDEYQSTHFCGGWTSDGDAGPGFYFSYYAPDGGDYIFYLTPEQATAIADGCTPRIKLEYWKRSSLGPYSIE